MSGAHPNLPTQAVFHGTEEEAYVLLAAIAHNCTCSMPMGVVLTTCAAHQMMLDGQRQLDGLVFMRRVAAKLITQEWCGIP